ncbi:Alpha/beta hydrolase fold-1,Alpha/Beta hydrolase fold [Cinara cedri]|uniref:Alpha/beta hydrolase fold-1,Alpha/Beta hydrolase fold n=1 Tax=Cinara cedri TaxID=506608 RepID=A0A5E4LZW3_9HEMI|nr:Alpha/beta hydrolase fold-1,Alpha/Beta hydrolase fold [Cinara cedri]
MGLHTPDELNILNKRSRVSNYWSTAKLWTNDNDSPKIAGGGNSERVLFLHGFQDNCGSFDRLIPLLDGGQHCTYLSFDWPNHGRSSRTPYGVRWSLEDYTVTIRRVADHVRWSAFVCVGHSMGGQVAKLFTAVYPDHVKKLVMLDTAGPVEVHPEEIGSCIRRALDELLKLENRKFAGDAKYPPPEYAYPEAVARIKNRMFGLESEDTFNDDAAKALMARYFRQKGQGGKYLLANDLRLKVTYSEWFSAIQFWDVVKNIKCPTLIIRASESDVYYNGVFKIFVHIYEQNPNFKIVRVQGNHDVHMNHPHRVAPLINKFLNNNSLCKL